MESIIYAYIITLEGKKNYLQKLNPTFISYFLQFVENLSSILIITGL
jgi:hypothetical protein